MHYVFCEHMPPKRDWRKRQHKLITYKYNGYADGSFNKNKKSRINQHLKQFQATKWNQFLQKEGFLLNKFLKKYLAYSLQHLMAIVEASTTSSLSLSLSLSLVLFTISFSSLSRSFWSFFLFFFPSLWFAQCFAAGPLKMSREMDLYLCFKFYSWLDHCWRHHQIFFFLFCFGFKLLPEMLFRKTWVFGWTSKFNQLKCFSPLTIKSFPFIFSLQTISGPSFRRAKRERERARPIHQKHRRDRTHCRRWKLISAAI